MAHGTRARTVFETVKVGHAAGRACSQKDDVMEGGGTKVYATVNRSNQIAVAREEESATYWESDMCSQALKGVLRQLAFELLTSYADF